MESRNLLIDASETFNSDDFEESKRILGIETFPSVLLEAQALLEELKKLPTPPILTEKAYIERVTSTLEDIDPIILGFVAIAMPCRENSSEYAGSECLSMALVNCSKKPFKNFEKIIVDDYIKDKKGFTIKKVAQDQTFINKITSLLISNPVGAHLQKSHKSGGLAFVGYEDRLSEDDIVQIQREQTKNIKKESKEDLILDRALFAGMLGKLRAMPEEILMSRPDLVCGFFGCKINSRELTASLKDPKIEKFWINALTFFMFIEQFSLIRFSQSLSTNPHLKPAWKVFLRSHFTRLKSASDEDRQHFSSFLDDFFIFNSSNLALMVKEVETEMNREATVKNLPSKAKPKVSRNKLRKAKKKAQSAKRRTRNEKKKKTSTPKVEKRVLAIPELSIPQEKAQGLLEEEGNTIFLESIPSEAQILFINAGKGTAFQKIEIQETVTEYGFRRPRYKPGQAYTISIAYGLEGESMPSGEVLQVTFKVPELEPVDQAVAVVREVEKVVSSSEPDKALKIKDSTELFVEKFTKYLSNFNVISNLSFGSGIKQTVGNHFLISLEHPDVTGLDFESIEIELCAENRILVSKPFELELPEDLVLILGQVFDSLLEQKKVIVGDSEFLKKRVLDRQLRSLKMMAVSHDFSDFELSGRNGYHWDRVVLDSSFAPSGSIFGISISCETKNQVGLLCMRMSCQSFEVNVTFDKEESKVALPEIEITKSSDEYSDAQVREIAKGQLFNLALQNDKNLRERIKEQKIKNQEEEDSEHQKKVNKFIEGKGGQERIDFIQNQLKSGELVRVLRVDENTGMEAKIMLTVDQIDPDDEVILTGSAAHIGRENYARLYESINSPYHAFSLYQRIRATVKSIEGTNGESRNPFENEYADILFEAIDSLDIDLDFLLNDKSTDWSSVRREVTKGNMNLLEVFIDLLRAKDMPISFQRPFTLTLERIQKVDLKN